MSKPIKITVEEATKFAEEVKNALLSEKMSSGKISFEKSFEGDKEKTNVKFTEVAWTKVNSLVNEFSDEIAWHGLVKRCDDGFLIYDIITFPQEVTGATVNTDQIEYQNWLMSQEDDVFNNIRMQGHSHVNMGVTPSGVDETLYDSILGQLDDNMFYIFMIHNKRGDITCRVYDLENNKFYDTDDCEVKYIVDDNGILAFIEDAKKKVVKKTYQSSYTGWKSDKDKDKDKSDKKEEKKEDKKDKSEKRKGKRKEDKKDFKNKYDISDYYQEKYGYGFD